MFFLTAKLDFFFCVGVPTILLCCVVKRCDLFCFDHPVEGFACFDCICVHPPPCHIQSFKPFVSALFVSTSWVFLPLCAWCLVMCGTTTYFPKAFHLSILPLQPSITFLFTVPFIQDMQFKMCPMWDGYIAVESARHIVWPYLCYLLCCTFKGMVVSCNPLQQVKSPPHFLHRMFNAWIIDVVKHGYSVHYSRHRLYFFQKFKVIMLVCSIIPHMIYDTLC